MLKNINECSSDMNSVKELVSQLCASKVCSIYTFSMVITGHLNFKYAPKDKENIKNVESEHITVAEYYNAIIIYNFITCKNYTNNIF